jgi:hypothetical protein
LGGTTIWGKIMLEFVQMTLALLIMVPCAGLVLHAATRAKAQ